MSPNIRMWLEDVVRVCGDIEILKHPSGDRLRDELALERAFEVIGEALVRIRNEDPERLDRISSSSRVIGLRNLIAHGYEVVDHAQLVGIAESHVPQLKLEVEAMLDDV